MGQGGWGRASVLAVGLGALLSSGAFGLIACGAASEGPQTQGGPAACVPGTCESLGATCGTLVDDCGRPLECGECGSGTTCGGGGTPNLCGSGECVPRTCEAAGANCGLTTNGCGGLLDCGYCPTGLACGGSGKANVCGSAECREVSCAAEGASCGRVFDGCGGYVECGSCGEGQACANLACEPVTPIACAQVQLGAKFPVSETISMSGRTNAEVNPCQSDGVEGADVMVGWTAPYTGTFVFGTHGSTFFTSLNVRRGGCDSEALECGSARTRRGGTGLVLALEGGESVAIGLEGAPEGAEGEGAWVHLQISDVHPVEVGVACFDGADSDSDGRVDCEDLDCAKEPGCRGDACASQQLDSVPAIFEVGAASPPRNDFTGSCSGTISDADVATRFIAPADGTYRFNASSGITALFLVHDCRGEELACDASSVTRTMTAGQSVLVVAEGKGSVRIERAE